MLDASAFPLSEKVFDAARRSDPEKALLAACQAATGQDGFLAGYGYALHAPACRIVDPASPAARLRVAETLDEPVLEPFGLCLSRLAPRAISPRMAETQITVAALRLGLLAQILDRCHAHLEGRDSFGRKTLHHQLVKAQFSATGALLSRLREELTHASAANHLDGEERIHVEIDTHMVQASKLMGGHGLRATSVHGIEYISYLIRAILAAGPQAGA